ncbi:RebB family R body protein [Thalassospira sp.]|uniref:RebB family R body protein n=1 Tax=Thalassospira sp. TaxID=1912094 RepID=UPI0027363A5B|nr:RebB family R body protein [Thalassospira sp.]MDP2696884.1 RebB family R body protein [Thalassospira sp.]
MTNNTSVDEQITDGITQTNTAVIGSGPAMGAMQSYLAQAQAQGILFSNMVNEQQQLAVASLATTVEAARSTLNMGERRPRFQSAGRGPDFRQPAKNNQTDHDQNQ